MITLADDLRTARLQVLADAMSGGTLTLYTEPQPAIGAAITTQTALVSVAIPAGLTAVDASVGLALIATTILADGDADWGRITSAADDFVLDGDCGLLASSAAFRLKTVGLVAGANLMPISAAFAEP